MFNTSVCYYLLLSGMYVCTPYVGSRLVSVRLSDFLAVRLSVYVVCLCICVSVRLVVFFFLNLPMALTQNPCVVTSLAMKTVSLVS